MRTAHDLLAGLLDAPHTPGLAAEDLAGPHAASLTDWRQRRLLSALPSRHPVPSCPYCVDGVPYRLPGGYLCSACHSRIDEQFLQLWPFDREAFCRWLAEEFDLQGGVRSLDGNLWQLGTWEADAERRECFLRTGPLSQRERERVGAYRDVIVFFGLTWPPEPECRRGVTVSILDLLASGTALAVRDLATLLRPRGTVRFDFHSGALWVGESWLGEAPLGSKEFAFLACLARELDHFVSYADLKRTVLRETSSSDETEEATFCQGLKSRIKRKWVPEIDRLIVTTNKGDGYRLRAYARL